MKKIGEKQLVVKIGDCYLKTKKLNYAYAGLMNRKKF